MKTTIKALFATTCVALMASFANAQAPSTLQELLEQVKKDRVSEARVNPSP